MKRIAYPPRATTTTTDQRSSLGVIDVITTGPNHEALAGQHILGHRPEGTTQ